MSRSALSSLCRGCQSKMLRPQTRSLTSSARLRAEDPAQIQSNRYPGPDPSQLGRSDQNAQQASQKLTELAELAQNEAKYRPRAGVGPNEPYHLNVYTHKHNTHIAFTHPSRDVILAYSAGDIGLKKAQRGTYDAGYQLATYMFRKMTEINWRAGGKKAGGTPLTLNSPDVIRRGIELVFRSYGNGREAFQKCLLGQEGRMIKPMIKKVTDATRLKFGGSRSPAVRRLG